MKCYVRSSSERGAPKRCYLCGSPSLSGWVSQEMFEGEERIVRTAGRVRAGRPAHRDSTGDRGSIVPQCGAT